MPMPWTYRHASKEWRAFLDDVKDRMSLDSDNMAYTAVDAVFQVFRRRLTAQQGLDFAGVLPTVLRAIFVHGWHVTNPPTSFPDRNTLIAEVKSVRAHHNLTPDNAIEATAWALRRCTNRRDFDRMLAQLPHEAVAFWHVEVEDFSRTGAADHLTPPPRNGSEGNERRVRRTKPHQAAASERCLLQVRPRPSPPAGRDTADRNSLRGSAASDSTRFHRPWRPCRPEAWPRRPPGRARS